MSTTLALLVMLGAAVLVLVVVARHSRRTIGRLETDNDALRRSLNRTTNQLKQANQLHADRSENQKEANSERADLEETPDSDLVDGANSLFP
jgi:Tfp pilus assembly protein PilN